jgi:hypothetical protein
LTLPRARSIAGVVLSIACLRVPDTPSSSRLDVSSRAALAWAHVVVNAAARVHGDPLADITALGRLHRVIARGRDYLPDSGRFDVSAPGTPFAAPGRGLNLDLLTEATRLRQP